MKLIVRIFLLNIIFILENSVSTSQEIVRNSHTYNEYQKTLQFRKYNLIGSSQLNLLQILVQNEDLMERQGSKIFVSTSNLYRGDSASRSRSKNEFSDENKKHNINTFKLFDTIQERFVEEIFLSGTKVGRIEGIIQIENIPLLRQIMCGVHTENGMDSDSAYLGLINVYDKTTYGNNNLPKQIVELYENTKVLFNQIINITSVTQVSNDKQTNLMLDTLNNIILDLTETSKESVLFYNYKNTIDILKGQEMMIELGVKLLSVVNFLSASHRLKAIKILILILDRGELDLEMMTMIISGKVENYENICYNYISFLIQLLKFSLESLGKGLSDDNTTQFVEYFLSIAYFRIPQVSIYFHYIISFKNLFYKLHY